MTDTVTLPRSVVEQALEAFTRGCPPDCKDSMTDSGGVYPWGEPALIRCPACRAFDALRAALEQPQSPYGECDECGTPYSYDPTDGGCICVRCMKEELATKQPQGEQEPVAWDEEIIEFLHAHYDTEMIKELDSGDALIRLDDAIAAVEEVAQRYTHPQPKRQPLDTDTWPECPAPSVRPVYAISANTKSVRDGFEVGGYEKTPPLFTKSQLYDYALNVLRAHGIGGDK